MAISANPDRKKLFSTSVTFDEIVKNSEKVNWQLKDIVNENSRFDFSKIFMPNALLGFDKISFLNDEELLQFNQVIGYSYLHLFYFVEEFIIRLMTRELNNEEEGELDEKRALSRFTDEEVKHQQLFINFKKVFDKDFGLECEVLESAKEVATRLLVHSTPSLLILTFHLEVVTQAHFTEAIRENDEIDPLFAKLFRLHWIEEMQHAQIDFLKLQSYLSGNPGEAGSAFNEYTGMLNTLDGFLETQSEMNARSLEKKLGRSFSDEQKGQLTRCGHRSLRNLFIIMGLQHDLLVQTIEQFVPTGRLKLDKFAREIWS